MTKNQWTKKVIDLFPSETLKKAIKEQKYSFSDYDLLSFVYHAKPYDKKLKLVDEAIDCFTDKRSIKLATDLRKYYQREYELFMQPSKDAVYETSIQLHPNGSKPDVYITKTFEDALIVIRAYLQYLRDWDKPPLDNPEAKYIITKKTAIAPSKPHEIYDKLGDIGSCILGYRLKILEVDIWKEDKFLKNLGRCRHKEIKNCNRCEDKCILPLDIHQPKFPVFLEQYDLVAYHPHWLEYHIRMGDTHKDLKDNLQYGVLTTDMRKCPDDTHVVLLDNPYVKERNGFYQDEQERYCIYDVHDHPSYAELFKPNVDEVPKEIYDDYLYTVEVLKEIENE